MLRLSKMADYGIVLMNYIAGSQQEERPNARSLSALSGLPLPTVSKVLKSYSRAGLLVAHRGQRGGYTLAKTPEQISVADMIAAIDGPIGLTDCSKHAPGLCDIENTCPVRNNWGVITRTVHDALDQLSLAQMSQQTPCSSTPATQPRLELVRS